VRVIAVRHYKTKSNSKGLIIGWGDSPRADDWEKDLLFVDGVIKRQGVSLDAIYSSDLDRAMQTAAYYAEHHGIATVHHEAAFKEVNYGRLYQQSKHWVSLNIPQYKTDADFIYPDGESFRQMQKRSVEFLLSLQYAHHDDTLLLVAHAGVLRGLVCHFLRLDYNQHLKRRISHRYIGDFRIENSRCTDYSELGRPSGFIKDGVLHLPTPHSGMQQSHVLDEAMPGLLQTSEITNLS
jgi:alpha-ribazole phosphatase